MITIIYGEKGTGKTKQIIDHANDSGRHAKGLVVFVDKDGGHMHNLDTTVRLVNAGEYKINEQTCFIAFIKGMLATNFDIEKIYIDGLARIVGADIQDMEVVYNGLEEIASTHKVEFIVTASCAQENLPEFVAKHLR